jgi:hypothetical protein
MKNQHAALVYFSAKKHTKSNSMITVLFFTRKECAEDYKQIEK